MNTIESAPGIWAGVVGQPTAVSRLRQAAESPVHAYLFAGPAGSTKNQAARAFAARLLTGSDDPTGRDPDLVLRGQHPDVHEVERAGARILFPQAMEIVRTAALAPTESDHKVFILHEFHLVSPEGAALLLKTIEEPPPSTTFVILADFVPHDLVTIASRCARIDFGVIPDQAIVDQLVADGTASEAASEAARSAAGNLERARLLAGDSSLGERRRAFADVPHRLDGSGATVMTVVDQLLALIDDAAAPLTERQAAEVVEVDERIERYGQRGSGKASLEQRHKRELRRHRTDELLAGLTVIAGVYRDALVAGTSRHPDELAEAVDRIHQAMESFEVNANETLMLQALLWSLPSL